MSSIVEFIRYKPTYPFSTDKQSKFWALHDRPRSYRYVDFAQSGYNPHSNTVKVPNIVLNAEHYTIPKH